ncbi:MAG: BspA family leucine-rich repeat surface protein [Trueperaceae bacterium]|nr:BspA family leucine-rich repeat surface protein [Trueperaceae bacterium]
MHTPRLLVAVASLGLVLAACGLRPSDAPVEASTRAPLEVEVVVDADTPTATLPLRGDVVDVVVDWDEGARDCPDAVREAGNVTCAYDVEDGAATTKTVTVTAIPETGPALEQFGNGAEGYPDADAIQAVRSFGDVGLTRLAGAFRGAENLKAVPDTLPSTVDDLGDAFKGATTFNQDLSGWDVRNVTTLTRAFQGARTFNNGAPSGTDAPLDWTLADGADTTDMFDGADAFAYAGTLFGAQDPTTLDVDAFAAAGVSGVDATNVDVVTAVLVARGAAAQADAPTLQAIVNAHAALLAVVETGTGTLSAEQLAALGFDGLLDDPASATKRALFADALRSADPDDVATYAALAERAGTADALVATAVTGSADPRLTVERLDDLGITGVHDGNLDEFLAALAATDDPSDLATLDGVQDVADDAARPDPGGGDAAPTPTSGVVTIGGEAITVDAVTYIAGADRYSIPLPPLPNGTRSLVVLGDPSQGIGEVEYNLFTAPDDGFAGGGTTAENRQLTIAQNAGTVTITGTVTLDNTFGTGETLTTTFALVDVAIEAPAPPPPGGGGGGAPPLDPMVLTTVELSASDTVALQTSGQLRVTVDWGEGADNCQTVYGAPAETPVTTLGCQWATGGVKTIRIQADAGPAPYLENFGTLENEVNVGLASITSFGDLGITGLRGAFLKADATLASLPTDLPDTVTDLSYAFQFATHVPSDVTQWDTSNVTNMAQTFNQAESFDLDLSGWDTSSVTNMTGLFQRATAFDQDISGWDVGNVESMAAMFKGTALTPTDFDQDLSGWDVANVSQRDSFDDNSNDDWTEAEKPAFPPPPDLSAVALGLDHACAVDNGTLACWGADARPSGKLGSPDGPGTGVTYAPVTVSGSDGFGAVTPTDLALGEQDSCVLEGGTVYCWGQNYDGQLGVGVGGPDDFFTVAVTRATPVVANAGAGFANTSVTDVAIQPGTAYRPLTCAIENGSVFCWGFNGINDVPGALGDGTTNASIVPVAVSATDGFTNANATAVDAGFSGTAGSSGSPYACALEDGSVFCWGNNARGTLGTGTTYDVNTPTRVASTTDFDNANVTAISASRHTCAIEDGSVYCWGRNDRGQLGDLAPIDATEPVFVSPTGTFTNTNVTAIDTGWNHTCALEGGSVYCWGANEQGQLGDGSNVDRTAPVEVDAGPAGFGNDGVDAIALSLDATTCALKQGDLFCWGGDGDAAQRGSAGQDAGLLGAGEASEATDVPTRATLFE